MPPRHKKKSTASVPSTAEEFFFQGGQDEERGERWLSGNDLSKGLRFYASALENYNQCVKLSPATSSDKFDAAYNIVRLKFDVWYEVYESGDYLLSGHMTQAGGHTVGLDSLLSNIFVSQTKQGAHEEVLQGYKQLLTQLPSGDENRTWDVLHGYGLALTTHIEEYGGGDDDVTEALNVFESVYKTQLEEYNEFKRLLEELESGEGQEENSVATEKPTEKSTESPKYANAEESVNLEDLVETLTCIIKLASLTSQKSPIRDVVDEYAQKATHNLLQTVQEMADIISKEGFSADIAKTTDGLQSTLMDAAQTIGMWIASRLTPSDLEAFWKGEKTDAMQQVDPLLPEFLSHASGAQWTNAAVQSILDVVEEEGELDDSAKWTLFGAANRLLQQQVKSATPSTQSPVGLDILTTYSKLPKFQLGLEVGQMYISLADIDVMRARLSTEAAEKFGATLLKNAATYYTSAENTLSMGTIGIKTAGGVVRKQRRLKSEATVKKLMLEGSDASVAKAKRVPGWEVILE
ncbi:hypothetical protein CJU90_1683 [Yarrowia sp. C11]|nr:hypothetical protein CKK34_0406 [Yarrowia sp. E02]KAG5371633.1 hypothetical protein CJU90_1683 [Yarrowia sp. C11]